MDQDGPETEVGLAEFRERPLGPWGVLQIAAGTGLSVYAVWAGVLMPGFRRVPLKLQVPYLPASRTQVRNVMALLKGRSGGFVDLGSGDGRIVLQAHSHGFHPAVGYELNPWLLRLSRFNAWRAGHYGQVSYLKKDLWKVKLVAELPDGAVVIAGRFPFPDWTPCKVEGEGVDQAWAYYMQAQRGGPAEGGQSS